MQTISQKHLKDSYEDTKLGLIKLNLVALGQKNTKESELIEWLTECVDNLNESGYWNARLTPLEALERKINEEIEHISFLEKQPHTDELARYLVLAYTEKLNKLVKKRNRLVSAVKDSNSGVTEQMIERAREHPIEDFVSELDRGKIACPFHHGKKLQMSLDKKTNLVRCWTDCGKSFDSIELYKVLHGCDFVQAVKALQ